MSLEEWDQIFTIGKGLLLLVSILLVAYHESRRRGR
jgi:hypothetical protein